MVTIDVPICIALGSTVALRNQALLADRTPELRFRALALCAFGFLPLGTLFDLYFHDWQWQYLSPSLEPAFSLLFTLAMLSGGLLGFELTRRALLVGHKSRAMGIAAGALGFTSLYSLVFFRRVLWVGSYGEWTAGTATFMPMHASFMGLLTGCSVYLGVAVWLWGWRPIARANAPH